jgi:hypothetical protein
VDLDIHSYAYLARRVRCWVVGVASHRHRQTHRDICLEVHLDRQTHSHLPQEMDLDARSCECPGAQGVDRQTDGRVDRQTDRGTGLPDLMGRVVVTRQRLILVAFCCEGRPNWPSLTPVLAQNLSITDRQTGQGTRRPTYFLAQARP